MSIVLPKVGRPDIHTVRPKMRGSHFVENLPVSSNDKDIYSAVNEGETHSGANKVSENNTSKSPLRNVRFRVLVVTTARPSTHNSMVHPFATKGSLPDKSRRLVLPCLYCSPCERAKLCMPDVIITISFPSLHGLARSNAFYTKSASVRSRHEPCRQYKPPCTLSHILCFFKQVVYNLHSSNALIRINGLEVGINLSGQAVLLFLHPYPAHNFTGFRVFYHDHSASVFCFG